MNEVLDPVWAESIRRLRLGVEPVDATGSLRMLSGLGLHLETVPRPYRIRRLTGLMRPDESIGLPGTRRNPSGRFAITFAAKRMGDSTRLDFRVVDPSRHFVPRRFAVTPTDLAGVLAAEAAHEADPRQPLPARTFRPWMFPGAGYGVQSGATVIQGRVTWGSIAGPALPWARVRARATGVDQPQPWRAHADDRGEFVLVVGGLDLTLATDKSLMVDIDVVVEGRPVPPLAPGEIIDSPAQSRDDPLWHLPLEQVVTLDPPDPVVTGAALPPGYTARVTRTVRCRRGAVTRPILPFVLT